MPQSLVSVASAIINTQSFVTDSCVITPWAVTASSRHHPWAVTASSHHQYSVVRHCNRAAAVACRFAQSPFKVKKFPIDVAFCDFSFFKNLCRQYASVICGHEVIECSHLLLGFIDSF
ncbi:hypothetical protein CUMW_280280 [Citrus unshiu]|uniref:Uncharacterized protein n=1 Tax=Citrus unshiu TaxID=55188 RepID=A0A2H5NA59_CITUN|nr:hypothetical protein CUMW_280280 [Citrus unshiu]